MARRIMVITEVVAALFLLCVPAVFSAAYIASADTLENRITVRHDGLPVKPDTDFSCPPTSCTIVYKTTPPRQQDTGPLPWLADGGQLAFR